MTTILGASASGMVHHQSVIDVVANNVANVSSAGFKRARPLGEGSPTTAPSGGRLGVAETTRDEIFATGALERTDDPMHFTISDEAFFQVQDANGTTLLTRYGALSIDAAGSITAAGGRQLVPPVALPEGWSGPTIDLTGTVTARDDQGQLQELARLTLVHPRNPQGLESIGQGLYRETANSGPLTEGQAGDGRFSALTVGAVEGSNVDLAEEFTQLIIAQRAYQASAKTFSVGDEMLAAATNITR